MSKFGHWIAREFREILPAAIFFFVAFHFVALSRQLMLEQYNITLATSTAATVGALIVAKAILVADSLPFIDRFPNKPLVYNVLWATLIYGLITLVFRYLEELIPRLSKYGGLAGASEKVMEEVVWPHFLGIQLILVFFLLIFCILKELVRKLGAREVKELFFGRKSA